MMITDKSLLESYMRGFADELKGTSNIISENEIENNAYQLGATDAIIGDDLSTWDNQTDEEILTRIKNL